jgi:hypothetical protein
MGQIFKKKDLLLHSLLSRAEVIFTEGFVPSDEDILQCRLATKGFTQTTVQTKNFKFI